MLHNSWIILNRLYLSEYLDGERWSEVGRVEGEYAHTSFTAT